MAKHKRRKRPSRVVTRLLTWIGAAGVVALVVYGVFQTSGVRYSDVDMRVVDFSALTSSEKRSALQAANRARCVCGCGMTLAQCVATDSTCPLRDRNIDAVRTMAREADRPD